MGTAFHWAGLEDIWRPRTPETFGSIGGIRTPYQYMMLTGKSQRRPSAAGALRAQGTEPRACEADGMYSTSTMYKFPFLLGPTPREMEGI